MLAYYQLNLAQRRKRRRKHKWWVRPMLQPQLWAERGQYNTLMEELRILDRARFKNYTRLSLEMFDKVLERTIPRLQRQDTKFRKAISPGLKLAGFFSDIWQLVHLNQNWVTTSELAMRLSVATAIVAEFRAEAVNCPTTPEGWLEIARQFESRWNMQHCLGALDRKHIRIRKPENSGSIYFNYKLFCSIVLMAAVDANYISRTNS